MVVIKYLLMFHKQQQKKQLKLLKCHEKVISQIISASSKIITQRLQSFTKGLSTRQ